jgi:hypothetical protein
LFASNNDALHRRKKLAYARNGSFGWHYIWILGELQSVDEAATSLKAVHGVVGVQNEATMGGESEVVAPEASQPLAALHVQKSTSTENLNTNTVGYKDEEEMVPTVAVAQEEGLQEMTPPPALSFAERWPPAPAPQRPYGSIGPVDPPTTGLAR